MIDIVNTWLPMATFLVSICGILWKTVINLKSMVDKLQHSIETLNSTIKGVVVEIKDIKSEVKHHDKRLDNIEIELAKISAVMKEREK